MIQDKAYRGYAGSPKLGMEGISSELLLTVITQGHSAERWTPQIGGSRSSYSPVSFDLHSHVHTIDRSLSTSLGALLVCTRERVRPFCAPKDQHVTSTGVCISA